VVPDTWITVVFFLVLAAPGILFDLLRSRLVADASETAFREAGRIILVSLLVSSLTAGVITLVSLWLVPPTAIDLKMVFTDKEYVAQNLPGVVILVVTQVLLSLGLVWIYDRITSRRFNGARLLRENSWTFVLRSHNPVSPEHTYARIQLTSGTVYYGRVEYFSPDLDADNREIVLGRPISVLKPGAQKYSAQDGYTRAILPGSQIESVQIRYVAPKVPG
jgi:Family of unknown function (DUF6338)